MRLVTTRVRRAHWAGSLFALTIIASLCVTTSPRATSAVSAGREAELLAQAGAAYRNPPQRMVVLDGVNQPAPQQARQAADETASPTPDPLASPTTDPTNTPTAEPTLAPTDDPNATPEPDPDPDVAPTPDPSATPDASPGPEPGVNVVPASTTERFEGSWPSRGWRVFDRSNKDGGKFRPGPRDCVSRFNTKALWMVGGGTNGLRLACAGKYPNNANTQAVYGPFDLTRATSSILSYSYSGASEKDYDFLYVGASVDGRSYCVNVHSGNETANFFRGTSFDLAQISCEQMPRSFLGYSRVYIILWFVSDQQTQDTGFFVDDVELSSTIDGAQPTATPTTPRPTTPTTPQPTTPTTPQPTTPTPPTPTTPQPTTPTLPPAPTIDLAIRGLEVTQAIQTPGQTVPLIAGRPAVARLTVDVVSGPNTVEGVTARLRAFRNGSELPNSPLTPFNPGGTFTAGRATDPVKLEQTLNFKLPSNWITSGDIELRAELNPERSVAETTYDNNRLDSTRSFRNISALRVVIVPIAYQPGGVGPVYRPDLARYNNGLGMLQKIFPIPGVQIQPHSELLFTGNLPSSQGWRDLLDLLTELRNRETGGSRAMFPIYYGVVPDAAVAGLNSYISGIGWIGASGGLGIESSDDTAAHEISHNLGLLHAPCGNPSSIDPEFPFPNGTIGSVGLDVYQLRTYSAATPDLQSYCFPKWISSYHYNRMLNTIVARGQLLARQPAEQPQDALLISGRILSDTTALTAALDYVVPVSSTERLLPTPTQARPRHGGEDHHEYRVELRDGAGGLLATYPFTPTEDSLHEDGTRLLAFDFAIAPRDDVGSLQLWHGDELLDTLRAATADPTVSASVRPALGNTGSLTVTTSASSPGGEPVEISLRYSADNGQSWQVVATELAAGQFALNTATLPASNNGLLEVIASNATRIDTTRLRLGTITNKAPLVSIADASTRQLRQGEPLTLLGSAIDIDEGAITGDDLQWTDKQGTVLGSGELLALERGLPVGTHVITLTARDANGVSGTAAVTVNVAPIISRPVVNQNRPRLYLPFIQR
jgi:outer membrane biosynthesis protein TonB